MLIPAFDDSETDCPKSVPTTKNRVLIVDLNNFARYPTLAIGYITAPLRQAGFQVHTLSPLSEGAPAFEREQTETRLEHLKRRLYFSNHPLLLPLREPFRKLAARRAAHPHKITRAAISHYLQQHPVDIILLSAYLNHRDSVAFIGHLAQSKVIPVLLGGPAFNQASVSEDWLDIPGVTAIFGGECDLIVPEVVNAALTGDDLSRIPGIFLKGGSNNRSAPPLHDLDRLPVPDYSDFPWHAYPHKIIPVMTGRGCAWGVCTFCSDVVTANGRGYRSRSPAAVMHELTTLAQRHQAHDFIFLDLKLNSNLDVWRTLISTFQQTIPDGKWIATVHVDAKRENGLTREELFRARRSGLIRISFGLETGSQRLNNLMAKGTSMERNDQFVQDAADAGISVRASMMLGYPGETAEDIEQSVEFLNRHRHNFDRIRVSLFKAIPGTSFASLYDAKPERFPGLSDFKWDYRYNRASYQYTPGKDRASRIARGRLLQLVHQINSKPLRDSMQQFDGLM